jgi:hypothetical protein
MPKEPKSRRNPGKSATVTGHAEGHARAPQNPALISVSRRCSKHRRNPNAAEIPRIGLDRGAKQPGWPVAKGLGLLP